MKTLPVKSGHYNLSDYDEQYQNFSWQDAEKYFSEKRYGDLKSEVAEVVISVIEPIQKRYDELINSKELDDILDEGAKKANEVAEATLQRVKERMGLIR